MEINNRHRTEETANYTFLKLRGLGIPYVTVIENT
jgi:hypothetical protein